MAYCFFENYLIHRKIHIWYICSFRAMYISISVCVSLSVSVSQQKFDWLVSSSSAFLIAPQYSLDSFWSFSWFFLFWIRVHIFGQRVVTGWGSAPRGSGIQQLRSHSNTFTLGNTGALESLLSSDHILVYLKLNIRELLMQLFDLTIRSSKQIKA